VASALEIETAKKTVAAKKTIKNNPFVVAGCSVLKGVETSDTAFAKLTAASR